MHRYVFVFLFSFTLVAAVPTAAQQPPLEIFVSVPPQRYLVERIGGEHVQVHVMLAPGETPETFNPSLRQLENLADSDLYFMVGVPFEKTWRNKLRDAAPQVRFIPCCYGLLKEGNQNLDPHIWTSPRRAVVLARLIVEALAQRDPGHHEDYLTNHRRLLAELEALDSYARERFAGRRTDYFITAHAAWGHLAEDYGLKELSVERNGREIGPRGLAELLSTARRQRIRTVFIQPQQGIPMARTLAHQLNAELISLDPLAVDYLANMTVVIDRIAGALR